MLGGFKKLTVSASSAAENGNARAGRERNAKGEIQGDNSTKLRPLRSVPRESTTIKRVMFTTSNPARAQA
jgi:hypothetical protein